MARKSKGESNLALIISLVFFILTSIALGVLYYMGIEETQKKVDLAKKAEADAKTATELKNTADLKLKLYKAFVGTATAEEISSIQAANSNDLKDEHTKLVAAANAKLSASITTQAIDNFKPEDLFSWNWPASGTLPPQPSPATLLDRFTTVVSMKDRTLRDAGIQQSNAVAEQTKLKDAQKQAGEQAAKLTKDLEAEIAKLAALSKSIEEAKKKSIDDLNAAVNDHAKSVTAKQQIVDMTQAKLNESETQLNALKEKSKQLEEQLNGINEGKQGSFVVNVPHGEITSRKDRVVEINLGSADNLKEGQTFTIQPASTRLEGLASRKVTKYDSNNNLVISDEEKSKGSIEVMQILGPHSATARITDEPDSIRESILKGDLLYNPVFKKGVPEHVALVGIFDLNADQADDIAEVVKELGKKGLIVECYFDLATRKWVSPNPKVAKPGPTFNTTYVIKGWLPESSGAQDPLQAAKSELTVAITTALGDAKAKNAKEVRASEFFSKIGMKVSPKITEETVNNAAAKFLKDVKVETAPMDK
jgi:hypothetical protein